MSNHYWNIVFMTENKEKQSMSNLMFFTSSFGRSQHSYRQNPDKHAVSTIGVKGLLHMCQQILLALMIK